MSYKKGMLLESRSDCERGPDGECDRIGDCIAEEDFVVHSHPFDSTEFKGGRVYGQVYLPHSCNEWVIGGRENVEALISDLQAWLKSDGETRS